MDLPILSRTEVLTVDLSCFGFISRVARCTPNLSGHKVHAESAYMIRPTYCLLLPVVYAYTCFELGVPGIVLVPVHYHLLGVAYRTRHTNRTKGRLALP